MLIIVYNGPRNRELHFGSLLDSGGTLDLPEIKGQKKRLSGSYIRREIMKQAHTFTKLQVKVPICGEMTFSAWLLKFQKNQVDGCLNGCPYLYMYSTSTNTQRNTALKNMMDLKLTVKNNQRTSED